MQENVRALRDIVTWIKIVPNNQLGWHMERLEYFTNELFKYAKFKVGQKVKLIKVPQIDEKTNHGWISYKHILTQGAVATVIEVDHYNGRFRYALVFTAMNKIKVTNLDDVLINTYGGSFAFYEEYLASYRRNNGRKKFNIKFENRYSRLREETK